MMRALLVSLLAATAAAAADPPCARRADLAAPCFSIRGRIRYNANLRVYIWPVGTKRILGVIEDGLPESLSHDLKADGRAVFADLNVCPTTREKPGVMQRVCVDSAKNLVIR